MRSVASWQAATGATGELLRTGTLLLVLAALVGLAGGYHAGFAALQGLARVAHEPLPWALLSELGETSVLLSLTLLVAKRRPQLFWALLLGAVVAALLSRGLKVLVDAPRPAAVLPAGSLTVVGDLLRRHSFPSGHTLLSFLYAGILLCHLRSGFLRAAILIGAGFIGFSRIAVGAHWPVDVLAGAGVGLLGAALSVLIAQHSFARLSPRVLRWLVAVPILAAVGTVFSHNSVPAARLAGLGLAALVLAYFALTWLRRPAPVAAAQ